MEIEFDRAVVVVPLRVLAQDSETRYVSTEDVHQVLRKYRKYVEMSEEQSAMVSRLSDDMYEAMAEDSRSLLDHVARTVC